MESKSQILPFIIIIILLAAAAGIYFLGNQIFSRFIPYPKQPSAVIRPEPQAPISQPQGLGADIVSQVENPVQGKLPETNPFAAPVNPFDSIYKNPFVQ